LLVSHPDNMTEKLNMNSSTRQDTDSQFKTGDADSYNDVVDYFDRYTERFARHLPGPMMDLAFVQADHHVLDVGTGTGIVALDVAVRLEDGGKVVGIDLSDGMLATAIAKAERLQLSEHTQFLKMDAENLEFPDNSFDAALSLYALRHFPNPEKSVAEIYRVVKPGANIVVAVGSQPTLVSLEGIKAVMRRLGSIGRKTLGRELQACEFMDSLVEKHIPKNSRDEISAWTGEHHEFSGSIKELVKGAGFGAVRSVWKGQYSIIESPEDFWLLQMTFSSLARKRITEADQNTVEKLKSEFYQACEQVLGRNGRLVYQTGAAIVSGRKPLS